MPTAYEKLSALLKELFQLDQADLDFGIYRIMNQKRGEITRFLDQELLPQVKAAFDQYRPADKKVIEGELQKAIQGAQALGVDPDLVPKVKEIREQLATYAVDTGALENEVYSHLFSFFRRYYDNGDFISMRRYKEGVYAIPYEGEEVKLHWANADQYYVKTTENFRDYAFRLPSGRLAHFKIVEAETEKDNRKAADEKERRFLLATEDSLDVDNDALVIRFEYHADPEKREQKAINANAIEAILANAPAEWSADLKTLAPSDSNPKRTLLEKHLADYTTRNTFDYFIHKDLRGFLRRELDFYIKNEVMRLDDIEDENAPRVEQYLSKIKVIRTIAHKIIEFLAQIEEFQKKLWLKKKFVVETNYCITLDRVPDVLYPEICANDAQREEWVRLFAIEEIKGDLLTPGFSNPLTEEFLKANPSLLLDTKFFNQVFKDSLLSKSDISDEEIDGLLIHSDNFQALNLLASRYKTQVDAVYIDPPYNTVHSEILYKNQFKHSSWLSLIANTARIIPSFWREVFSFGVAIDDFEFVNVAALLDTLFPQYERNVVVVNHHPQGAGGRLSRTHEYFILISPSDAPPFHGEPQEDYQEDRSFMRSGTAENNFRYGRWKSFYALLLDPKTNRIVDAEDPVPLGQAYPTEDTDEGYIRIYPINSKGEERVWRSSYLTGRDRAHNNELTITDKGTVYQAIDHESKREVLFSNWTDSKFNSGIHGSNVLRDFGLGAEFDYPKSVYTLETALWAQTFGKRNAVILDYFAGSGTTGHAVINLNNVDNGGRKYILVEMGSYFETATKPRIEKVIYSNDWAAGKPVSRKGTSHCFKYIRLESYEDAFNNLVLSRTKEQQLTLEANPEFRENYLLSYMLSTESQGSLLNIQSFVHPFDYQLNIATGAVGESKPTKIDLVETFNYLIGLRVETMQTIRGFRVITGRTPANDRTLVIWRDMEEKSNADLETFFQKQDYNPRDMEFDLIYVNGDNNLENLRRPDETWKVRLIEEDFLRLMFDTETF